MEEPVPSMPGVVRRSVDLIAKAAVEAQSLGIPAICIFPYTDPSLKTEDCAEAWNPDNLSNRAIRAIKAAAPEIAVMTDVALDPYNINGHDGFVVDGEIVNDQHGRGAGQDDPWLRPRPGADIIGPSDMMDGRIGAMRPRAWRRAGHQNVMILSYAAKYASAFYGPFRDAVGRIGRANWRQEDPIRWTPPIRERGSAPDRTRPDRGRRHGDDQARHALSGHLPSCERRLWRAHISHIRCQVSTRWFRRRHRTGGSTGRKVMLESLLAFKRAGCDGILTYFAPEPLRASLQG